jgi:hypothetical protein
MITKSEQHILYQPRTEEECEVDRVEEDKPQEATEHYVPEGKKGKGTGVTQFSERSG